MLFVTVLSCLALSNSPVNAQIGPNLANPLGIYGSAPVAVRANVRYVRLENYPEVEGGLSYVIPVNGATNFNFFYTPDGFGFLSGGGYKVTYLGANQTTSYGSDIVTYQPNVRHTNGVKVRDFNILSGASASLGIHDVVRIYVPNGGGAVTFLPDALIRASSHQGGPLVFVRTNGNGYFSVYYNNGSTGSFLNGYLTHWDFYISGTYGGCSYAYNAAPTNAIWLPSNFSDPSQTSYYVYDAETVPDIPIISPEPPCHL